MKNHPFLLRNKIINVGTLSGLEFKLNSITLNEHREGLKYRFIFDVYRTISNHIEYEELPKSI